MKHNCQKSEMVPSDKAALVTLSKMGLALARKLSREMGGDIFAHRDAGREQGVESFERIIDLTRIIFERFRNIVYILPTGVAVRAIAPCMEHKACDPAVVVVDVGGRWAVSLLSGHEGGANDLALRVANIIGCEPVITTSTQAEKDIIVGVGCRKGANTEDIILAISSALKKAGVSLDRVRLLASADIKKNEAGLVMAAQKLGLPLIFIASDIIINTSLGISRSGFVMDRAGLPGVAEPCALLAGRNTRLILGKTICKSVTTAVARENFLWWE